MVCAAEYQAVTERLFFWQAYEPAVKCDLSCCALATEAGLIFVDPIPLAPAALKALTELSRPAAILLTNGNHARAASLFHEQFGVPIYAPAEAVLGVGCAVDFAVSDGDALPGGLRALALPGGGVGEMAYIGGGIACVGDAIIHTGEHGFSLLPSKYRSQGAALHDSLRKLLSSDFHILTFAHGTPLVQNARARLAQLLT